MNKNYVSSLDLMKKKNYSYRVSKCAFEVKNFSKNVDLYISKTVLSKISGFKQ